MVTFVKRLISLLLPLAVVVCAACGNQTANAPSGDKTLIVEQQFASYDSLDPPRGTFPVPILVDKSVYDTLLTINPRDQSKPYPALATSFSESSDGQTFTFHLRHGAKFAGGNPVTSADVVWSLTRLKNLKAQASVWMNGLTVTASDASTVVITSDTPNPAVPIEMTISNAAILDSTVVQQHGGTQDATDGANDYLNANSAGSGPYMVASADRTSQIVLKLNPNYWGPRPAYSTVVLRNVPAATQALDIQDGQAQLAIDVSPQDAASMGASVNVIAAPSADVWLIGMNASASVSPLTANQDFRDAVRYGLDYKGLVALAGKGAIQGTGFVPVGVLGALPASAADQRDVARAKAALAKVGVPNPTVDLGYYTDRVLDGLPIAPVAAKIQSDLKEVGITVNLVGQPIAVLLPKLKAGKFPMWIRGASSDFPDPSDFLNRIPGPGGVLAKWQNWVSGMNPSIDALVATATAATTTSQRDSGYKALVKATNDTAYTLYPVQLGRNLVCAKSVSATLNPFDYVDLGLVT